MGSKPFETIKLAYGDQVLWPDHCIQGTPDAALYPKLNLPQTQLIVRKGFHAGVDSYSAFEEADRHTPTGLEGYLRQRAINTLFVAGLATDFCIQWTALDARKLGFDTYVIEDACRGIDINGSVAAAWKAMSASGVIRIESSDIQLTWIRIRSRWQTPSGTCRSNSSIDVGKSVVRCGWTPVLSAIT